MSDTDEIETNEDEDSPVITRLRQQARDGDAARKEADSLKRELAFARAGIDTTTKAGSLLFKAWEGDPSDIEALKAEAAELGIGAPPVVEEKPTEDTGTATRRMVADGAPADFGGSEDPRKVALGEAQEAIKNGARAEVAQGHFINQLAQAAIGGDQRVILDPKGMSRRA